MRHAQLCGSHDSQYRVSDKPDAASVRGKRVLILDDAVASGGVAARTAAMSPGSSTMSLGWHGGMAAPMDHSQCQAFPNLENR